MGIFTKNESSVKIQKKINALRGQLNTVEIQVSAKEAEIEKAVSTGSVPDKLFTEAGNLKARADAVRTVLSKIEIEHATALEREEHERKTAEFDQFGRLVEKNIAGLESSLADISDAAAAFLEKETAFNVQYRQLFEIPSPAGLDFRLLPNMDIGFVVQALATRPPVNTAARAVASASAAVAANLLSIRQTMRSRLAQVRNALEIKAAPPVVEPTVPMAPKKRVQIIDGMPKDLYLQRKKEDRAKRKAKETERDVSVRTMVAERDAALDAAGQRHF